MFNSEPSHSDLTKLLSYFENKQYEEAENLAIIITEKFPNHPFSWKILGVIYSQTDRLSKSLEVKWKALDLDPKDHESQFNLANTLRDLGRLDEAEVCYRKVLDLKPDHIGALEKLGTTLNDKGDREAAIKSYKKAIKIEPNFAEVYNLLGMTLKGVGRIEEAKVSYERAIEISPDFAEAYYNLGIILTENSKLEDAEYNLRQAITLRHDFSEAYNNLGNLLELKDDMEQAELNYRLALRINTNYTKARINLAGILKKLEKYEEAIKHFDLINEAYAKSQSLECLYKNQKYIEFNKRLNSMAKKENRNIRIAAVSAFAAHQLKQEDPYEFCKKPLDYIIEDNLANYDMDWNNLINGILKESVNYKLTWESRTTKIGFQGPNDIFEKPSELVSRLQHIIEELVDVYYSKFNSEANTFIKSWPFQNKLIGWYNRLEKNGYQISHIHPDGWLSGVVYLKTASSLNNDEGAIEFGLHGYDLPIKDKNYPRKIFNPRAGDIVLFPSSLFHRTIPFTTNTERCVIAFDIKPL
jgi:tetratricopeptide (TPR) repeat protein